MGITILYHVLKKGLSTKLMVSLPVSRDLENVKECWGRAKALRQEHEG